MMTWHWTLCLSWPASVVGPRQRVHPLVCPSKLALWPEADPPPSRHDALFKNPLCLEASRAAARGFAPGGYPAGRSRQQVGSILRFELEAELMQELVSHVLIIWMQQRVGEIVDWPRLREVLVAVRRETKSREHCARVWMHYRASAQGARCVLRFTTAVAQQAADLHRCGGLGHLDAVDRLDHARPEQAVEPRKLMLIVAVERRRQENLGCETRDYRTVRALINQNSQVCCTLERVCRSPVQMI